MTNVTVSAKQARDNFSDLLGRVRWGEEIVMIEKKGRPYGVLISPSEYERYKKITKEQFFKTTEQIQKRNIRFSEKEVLDDVTRSVSKVRQKMYDREK
ncbi:type II toxin-antitoxin system Phd/YefM family antitoxin [Candidatus Curtissbacteria bacterium]|nr:type II toxin-antitoxin system Phd/YefM family antitoxin [Candidatus Curtissbacteria bacterium]